jgi:hypothetical protein
MQTNALTIVARIKPEARAALEPLLLEIGGDIAGNSHIDFSRLTTAHFLRWVILDNDDRYPPQLAFESNFDGTVERHVDEMIAVAAGALCDIYGHCEGLPASARTAPAQLRDFLLARAIPYGAFYRAYPAKTVTEVRKNTEAVAEAQTFLDRNRARLGALPALEIRRQVIDHLHQAGKLAPPLPPPPPSILDRVTRFVVESRAAKVLLGIIALPFLVLALPFLALALPLFALWLGLLLVHERLDQSDTKTADEVNPDLVRQEDYKVQNQRSSKRRGRHLKGRGRVSLASVFGTNLSSLRQRGQHPGSAMKLFGRISGQDAVRTLFQSICGCQHNGDCGFPVTAKASASRPLPQSPATANAHNLLVRPRGGPWGISPNTRRLAS